MKEFLKKLKEELEGAQKVVFMGLGEEKLKDDGVGPYIITELLGQQSDRFKFINAFIDPMSRIDEIIEFEPSHLVLIDACELDREPGTVSILNREVMCDIVPISSHTIPIHIVIDLILDKLPDLKVFMIGIVPKDIEGFETMTQYKEGELTIDDLSQNIDLPFFDFFLSEPIQEVADQLIEILIKLMNKL